MLREGERVMPLELFFDLVYVLAITQCTALMVHDPTWEGVARALLVLGVIWWSWVGYSWLTSVVDPEEGAVRLLMFAAMAAILVVALCVPEAFAGRALEFALAYGVVRAIHIALFWIASRDDPDLRHSTSTLAASSAVGVGLLVVASAFDGVAQGAMWALAILLDYGGPFLFGAAGWKLAPGHFAERHRLIMIIALGESIVALGVGATVSLTAGVVVAAILAVTLVCAIWWSYFDVVSIVAERRLIRAAPGKVRNELARDSYSYLHLPMVAGIVLVALGLEETVAHVDEPLHTVPGAALAGGTALYLLAHVAFRLRNVRTLNRRRLALAIVLVALLPVVLEIPALAALALVTGLVVALVAYEAIRFADYRDRVRHEVTDEPPPTGHD